MFIKFETSDVEARNLAGSPLTGQLLVRINEALHDHYLELGIQHSCEYGRIESYPHYMKAVLNYKAQIDNWESFDISIQRTIIKTLCAPFSIDNETLDKLTFQTL